MTTEQEQMINECFDKLGVIHACENQIVLWYAQRMESGRKNLHYALCKRADLLCKLAEALPVTYPVETLFTTP